jgi:hypothetical protein
MTHKWACNSFPPSGFKKVQGALQTNLKHQ